MTSRDSDLSRKVAEDGVKELGYDEYVPIPSGSAIEMAIMLCSTQGIFTGPLLVLLCFTYFILLSDCFQYFNFQELFRSQCVCLHVSLDRCVSVAGISGGCINMGSHRNCKKSTGRISCSTGCIHLVRIAVQCVLTCLDKLYPENYVQ